VVRARPGVALLALLLAAAPNGRAQQPDSATAFGVGADPVGFLLENKDSLQLAPAVVSELVQVNLALFRRNQRLQRSIDSVAPPPAEGIRPRPLTAEQRERLAPLLAVRAANIRQARAAAWALLNPEQQERARQLEARANARLRGQARGPRGF
jgi:hypothetical protein